MTSTDSDLLRAILVDPADDTPRLVLADWLEENVGEVPCHHCGGGRPGQWMHAVDKRGRCTTCKGRGRVSDGRAARAEFIRCQVELARQSCEWKAAGKIDCENWSQNRPEYRLLTWCPVCRRTAELRQRERALWSRIGVALFNEADLVFPDCTIKQPSTRETEFSLNRIGGGTNHVRWSRGFISELRLPLAHFTDDLARRVFRAEPVTTVVLSDREPVDRVSTEGGREWGWCLSPNRHLQAGEGSHFFLPVELESYLQGGKQWANYFCVYPTRDAAQAALSRACVNYGRSLVGLDALPAETAEVRP